MPTAIAHQKFIRTTARKLRLVAALIKKESVQSALTKLEFSDKRASVVLAKVVRQAEANAINNLKLSKESLKVDSIIIEEGPTFKRFRPVSRGRAHRILKRSSHIKVVVSGASPITTPVQEKTVTKKQVERKKPATKK